MSASAVMLASVVIAVKKIRSMVIALTEQVASFPRLLTQGSTSMNAVSPDYNFAQEVGAV